MTKTTRRAALAGLGGTCLLGTGALIAGCEARSGRVLTVSDVQPKGYPTVEALAFMGRILRERTAGRLTLALYPGGVLGQERDALELAVFGGIDLVRVNIASLNAFVPLTIVPGLPFLFRSTRHMRAAMDGAPGARILAALEPHGLVGLAFYDNGARSLYTRSGPVTRPEDLAGLKIRVQETDLQVQTMRALGANPVPMAYGEVYQGLMQGAIDGAENNAPSYQSSRHFEVARHYSLTRHVMAPEVLAMSARSWARLSEADRATMRAAARDSVPVMRRLWDAREAEARRALVAGGAVMSEPELAPFRALARPVWDRVLRAPAMRSLADEIATFEEGR